MRNMRVLTVIPLFFLFGCYTYVPIQPMDAPRGASVRVHLSEAGAARLGPLLAPGQRTFQGTLSRKAAQALLFRIRPRSNTIGLSGRQLTQRVRVPRTDIVALERRELDRLRTVGGGIAAAAVVTGVVLQILSGEGSDMPPEQTEEPPRELRIPIVVWSHGWW